MIRSFRRYSRFLSSLLSLAMLAGWADSAAAQGARAARPSPKGVRKLAAGAEITIAPKPDAEDTFSRHDFLELMTPALAGDAPASIVIPDKTLAKLSKGTTFRRGAWYLEFTFKPLRIIWVEMPTASGTIERKPVWYMVYRLKNTGKHLEPVVTEGDVVKIQYASYPVKTRLQFVLESPEYKKAYVDRISPQAMAAIQQKEDPNRKFLNTVEMASATIEPSTPTADKSVWGVALWYDVDPRIDFFNIFVRGLSNAYKWQDPPAPKAGEPIVRRYAHKTLQLNFWRPGDENFLEDQEIYYGSPSQVDYRWLYR